MVRKYVLLAVAFSLSAGMMLAESEENTSSDQVTQVSDIVCLDYSEVLPVIDPEAEPEEDIASDQGTEVQCVLAPEFEIEAKATRCDLLLLFPVDFTVSNLTSVHGEKASYSCLFTIPGGVVIEFTISSKYAPVDIFAVEDAQDLVGYAIETLRSNIFKKLSSRENKQLTDEELRSIEQEVKRYAQESCEKFAKEYCEEEVEIEAFVA